MRLLLFKTAAIALKTVNGVSCVNFCALPFSTQTKKREVKTIFFGLSGQKKKMASEKVKNSIPQQRDNIKYKLWQRNIKRVLQAYDNYIVKNSKQNLSTHCLVLLLKTELPVPPSPSSFVSFFHLYSSVFSFFVLS